jgi:hypothetical protein
MDQADGMIVAPEGGVGKWECLGCYDAAEGIACSKDKIKFRRVRDFARR